MDRSLEQKHYDQGDDFSKFESPLQPAETYMLYRHQSIRGRSFLLCVDSVGLHYITQVSIRNLISLQAMAPLDRRG